MMQEKIMVSDALTGINASLKAYGGIIAECENQELRQALIQMRNTDETSQYELFKLAYERQYYMPAEKATESEVCKVKDTFTQSNS